MPTHINNTKKPPLNEDIKFIENDPYGNNSSTIISQQLQKTYLSNVNLLQQIQGGIYLLTIKKTDRTTSLALKKLSDRAQYALLPERHNSDIFCKLSINNLKNHCHGQGPTSWLLSLANQESLVGCELYFYYHLPSVENTLHARLLENSLHIKETLSNKTLILADHEFNYPLPITKLPALAIWHDNSVVTAIDNEIARLKTKFSLLKDLVLALKNIYKETDWKLENGHMHFTHKSITKTFDYASLLDDIQHARFEDRIEDYLSHFLVGDLDTSSYFPTVSVRSRVHLKARPQSLSAEEKGYAIVAAKEGFGKQTTVDAINNNISKAFSLWLNRAERHLFRHQYKARVIFNAKTAKNAFSLVGEQVATMAIFPGLVKGIFENLNIEAPKSVRVIAHNEDVLTIAHDTASWVDINAVTQKADALFRLVATDGADPLSLFEQIALPPVGVGHFQLKVVPDAFFELLETAHTMKHTMPPGHDHYLLGLAHECLHEWGLAVAEFQKALRLDNNDPDIVHGLGCALMEIGQVNEALPFLKRACEMMPEDPEVANNWGRSSLECGQIDDAIKAFERAVRLSPGSADYLKNLGDGYLLAARPTDALAILNKAVRCDPHFALAHASLASIHMAIGDEDLAKKHALLAYKENPVDPNIANLLWNLTLQKK